MPIKTTFIPKTVTTAAFLKAFLGIAYLKAFSPLLVAADTIPLNKTKTVVVLIPPPVEPGEAPINIKTIITIMPAFEKLLKLKVEKPAVRAETLLNNAPSQVILLVNLIITAPKIIKIMVTQITTFECIESDFHLNLLVFMSLITKKPIPPKMISIQVTTLRYTLFLYAARL